MTDDDRTIGYDPGREPGCTCLGYEIRTDYGTVVAHDVDRTGCPLHDPDVCRDCGEAIEDSRCRPATVERGWWRYCMTMDRNTSEAPEHDLDHPPALWGNGDGGCGHPDCEDGTYVSPGALRAMVDKALTAHYEPTGLVLHPLDHASVAIDPAHPETVEAAKRVADAFGTPYWMVGVPGYRPPLRIRARSWVRRLPRRVLSRIPGVTYRGFPRETGEGPFNDSPPEPRAWRWGALIGKYRIGSPVPEPPEPFFHGDDDEACTEDHP